MQNSARINLKETFKDKVKAKIPFQMQKALYSLVKKIRFTRAKFTGIITKQDVKNYLKDIGIKEGDTVLVHSSLGRIGYVEKGAHTIIEALMETVGLEGLVVFPTFTALEQMPTRVVDREKIPIFDVMTAQCYTGKIPETFRQLPGVRRSESPTHSLVAFGKGSHQFVSGHDAAENPFSKKGPFGRLLQRKTKVLLIGVDQLANTCLHIVEDDPNFPVKVFTEKFKVILVDRYGREKIIMVRKHLPHLAKTRVPNLVEPYLIERGVLSIHPFGNTEVRLMEILKFQKVMEDLAIQQITIYPNEKIFNARKPNSLKLH